MEDLINLIQSLTTEEARQILNAKTVSELPEKTSEYLSNDNGILTNAIRLNHLRDAVKEVVINKFKNNEL